MLDSYCVKLLYNVSLMLYMCTQVEWDVGAFAGMCLSACSHAKIRHCAGMIVWMSVCVYV